MEPLHRLSLTQHATTPDGEAITAMAFRLLCLMTHYSKPLDFTNEKLAGAVKTYRKFMSVAERGEHTNPPTEFMEAICDDMNTAKCLSFMHLYCKRKEGDKLFAAMLLLGLIPLNRGASISDMEIKTPPLPETVPPIQGPASDTAPGWGASNV